LVLRGCPIAPQFKFFGKLNLIVGSEATSHIGVVVPVCTHIVLNEKGRLATAFYSLLYILILILDALL